MQKPGIDYRTVVSEIQTMDLLAFRGSDFVSATISGLQKRILGSGSFTHVGLCIRGSDFPTGHKYHCPESVYVWESTQSGPLADKVYNVDQESFLGVQLRPLDKVLESYDNNEKSQISWFRLQPKHRQTVIKSDWIKVFESYNGRRYDGNCLSLVASLVNVLRPIRRMVNWSCCRCTRNWLFCSELVATVYKDLGILQDIIPDDVVPMDFIPKVECGEVCMIIPETPTYDLDNQVFNLFDQWTVLTYYPMVKRKDEPSTLELPDNQEQS